MEYKDLLNNFINSQNWIFAKTMAESCDLINRCIIPEEEHKPSDYPMDMNNREQPEWRWCLVGNIVEEHKFGENHEIRKGTKHFAPGAKVYCAPTQWGDGYENIVVIGSPRHGKRYIEIVMPCKHVDNFRIQKVFKPALLRIMNQSDYQWWSNTDEEKDDLIRFLKSFKPAGYHVCSNEHYQFD